jgi:integrase
MALTDVKIKTAKPLTDKDYKLSDSDGLYLFVTKAGGKLWRLKYRFEGKEKVLSFGAYPEITLQDARAKRDDARKLLANSIDPGKIKKDMAAEKKANEANTFKVWAALWLEHWSTDKSPRHVAYTQRRLEADIYPAIGDLPMSDIEAPQVADIMRAIASRGALDIAKRAHQAIGQVFRYAIANDTIGKVKRNPASDIKLSDVVKPRKVKNQARVDIKELPALLRAIDTSETRAATRIAIKLMAYTFVRPRELIEAKWSEIDLDAKEWRIPAERMKMSTPHIVPLADQAIELLNTLRSHTGSTEYLFHNQNYYTKPMSNNTILKALERMGYKGRMTGHGFRGIASTALHEQGYDHQHIETQLAHSARDDVSAAYNHALYLKQRTKMMQEWANYLDELKAGAKVIPIKGAA